MKNYIVLFILCLSTSLFAQKKKNGTIYIEHPLIETVEKFNTAFTTGDIETLTSLLSADFQWRTTNVRTPRTRNQLFNRSSYLSENVINFSIKHWGNSYPDVLEYAQDDLVDVKTYEWLTGYDKNTGVKLNMPRYATFRFDKDGKIRGLWVNDDQLLWQKAYDAYDTRKNGVVYKDHPFIAKVRLIIAAMQEMDIEKVRSLYSENTQFYDVMNSGEFEFKSLDEEMEDLKAAFDAYEIMNIQEIGYPDAIDYEGSQMSIISWWKMRIKNRKSGNISTVMQHIQHTLNDEGEIIREDYYYNPAQFPN